MPVCIAAIFAICFAVSGTAQDTPTEIINAENPFVRQAQATIKALQSESPEKRSRAAETLGYLRYVDAERELIRALSDDDANVRRNAAISLGWCGGRDSLNALVIHLNDSDWNVRQCAWIALTNLSGLTHRFEAMAADECRVEQASVWHDAISQLPTEQLPPHLKQLLASENHRDVERGVRTAGVWGGADAVKLVNASIDRWKEIEDETDPEAKWLVQAGIRALGRSGHPDALPALITFLNNTQWARYAADALGEFGGEQAATALLQAFPRYAKAPADVFKQTAHAAGTHPSDQAKFDSRDRILATPYAIAFALSRIPFESSENKRLLSTLAPQLAAQIPMDIDGLVVYEEEPHQQIIRHLLDHANLTPSFVEVAFRSLNLPAAALQMADRIETELSDWPDPSYASSILAALCRDPKDVPRLIALLDHPNHWVRINAAKTLMFINAPSAIRAIGERLNASMPEAEFGAFNDQYFAVAQGQDEFNDPAPRYREAFVIALGKMGAVDYEPLLKSLLIDDRNALEIQHAAARALGMLGTLSAIESLKQAELSHPYHSVRMVAREQLWKRDEPTLPRSKPESPIPPQADDKPIPVRATRFVFIRGDPIPYNPFQMDSWRQAYMTTDSGPTYRPGRNLYWLDVTGQSPRVAALTNFADGYVADCEVSYDGARVLFSRREQNSPWWHLYEIGVDGKGLRQLTDGPYHDVQPTELPNGRIAFSTSRLGVRDEYHGYLATGLATMHPDGDDIQVVGFNVGRDAEPIVSPDGYLVFSRLELFYSRMKTEFNLLRSFPDGTRMETLYGPERRNRWSQIDGGYANWTATGERHRQLRLVQPQAYGDSDFLLTTPAGPIITLGRHSERFIRERFLRDGGNDPWVITTPFVLDEDTLLVAAGKKQHLKVRSEFPRDRVDLGLYLLDIPSGELTLLYNDPEHACFEARPLHPRKRPPRLPESADSRGSGFSGLLYANSVFKTQQEQVAKRGRLLRVIEGQPQVARHMTHTSGGGEAWKNHGGTFARVLATVPIAPDGSFAVEVPADRLLHLQVLDSDRNVVGNQTNWMHLRPGEMKGCVGCHEPTDTAALAASGFSLAETSGRLKQFDYGSVVKALPDGDDQFRYRAKMWFKGHPPDEREERQRTVQSINWFGRP